MNAIDLIYEKRDGVAFIAINRPERRNALGDATTRQIVEVCEDAAADTAIRAVAITGSGDDAFCSGGDLQDTFQRGAGNTEQQWSDRIRQGPNLLAQVLQNMPKPVVASINGVAVGGGATIALACDLRIASDNARFCFPFVRVGITPEFGCSYLLQRTVGLGRANELLMLGEFVDAATAERYGLLNRVVPKAELANATQELLARLVALPAAALSRIKALQRFAQTADLPSTLEQEAVSLGASFISPEHREAVSRFLDRKSSR
ncbi:enoyl-CoA hydratase/isomerase family protein [Ottowia thiooxydans]|uniref:enoyl-CoA hydratase/isomerase family protein n=1 Tax=Ottowia thiooxydans TaxID=219182 RepID=UPI0004153CEE|nr:enoyl-CoA hydratase-related protein [Ottowia thiooxydans]